MLLNSTLASLRRTNYAYYVAMSWSLGVWNGWVLDTLLILWVYEFEHISKWMKERRKPPRYAIHEILLFFIALRCMYKLIPLSSLHVSLHKPSNCFVHHVLSYFVKHGTHNCINFGPLCISWRFSGSTKLVGGI